MSEENKAVLRRFYDEFFNGGNLDVADEIIAPDCPLYFGSMFMGTGPEAFKQTRTMMYGGFPDLHLTIEEMVAEGEKVAERLSARGTHEGEFMNVAPTGKRTEWQGQAIFHISEGKVLECRGMPDMLGLMQQIGAVPAPEQSEEASPPSGCARRAPWSFLRKSLGKGVDTADATDKTTVHTEGHGHLVTESSDAQLLWEGEKVISAQIGELELMEVWYEDDPTMRVKVNFPFFLGTGTKNTAVVYFEIEPGHRLGTHTDSAEEILLVLDGSAEVSLGDEQGQISAGEMAVVPAMVPHGLRNVGDETARFVGFFSSNVVVSTFDQPMMPFGQRVVGTPPVLEEEQVPTGDDSV